MGEGALKLFHNFLDGSETAGKKVEKAAVVFQHDTAAATQRTAAAHLKLARRKWVGVRWRWWGWWAGIVSGKFMGIFVLHRKKQVSFSGR